MNVEQDVLIKVCGMTNKDEVKEALTYGVNLIGLIFAKSPRSVNPDVAKEIVDVVRRYGEREERVTFREEGSIYYPLSIQCPLLYPFSSIYYPCVTNIVSIIHVLFWVLTLLLSVLAYYCRF